MTKFRSFFEIMRVFIDEFNFNGISTNLRSMECEDDSIMLDVDFNVSDLKKISPVLQDVVERVSIDFEEDIEEVLEMDFKKCKDCAKTRFLFKFR